ncbi:MAG TPA: response regulator [Elusimicrobiota bacterium]|nr:response regulator [Elusimicrobiota bacterium]
MAGRSYILVVDDDTHVAHLLTDHLESQGYRVTFCHDAAQAVVQAEGLNVGLVILDVMMSGFGTGIDAYKTLRARRRDLPILFLTAMAPAQASRIVPLQDPRVRLLHKPTSLQALLGAIHELTGAPRAPKAG